MKELFWGIIISFIIAMFFGFGSSCIPDKFTMAQFNRLQNGMSYAQCCGILEAEGELDSENIIDGVPGVMPTLITRAYSWTNSNGSNIMCIFQNNKLNTKAQAGLK